MGEEVIIAADDEPETAVSDAGKKTPVLDREASDTDNLGAISAVQDGKQERERVVTDQQAQASGLQPLGEAGGVDDAEEPARRNQQVEAEREVERVHVAMVMDQEQHSQLVAVTKRKAAGETSATLKSDDTKIDSDKSAEALPVEEATQATAKMLPSTSAAGAASPTSAMPFFHPFSVRARTWNPETDMDSHTKHLEEDTPKLENEGDTSAYDDLPPLDKMQKDSLSMEGESLSEGVPNSGPPPLMDDSAADLPVLAASEDLFIDSQHKSQPGSPAAKATRLQFYSPKRAVAARLCGQKDKAPAAELTLRHCLSDPISGSLMDDAMVAQCGHSFGHASLQRVLETNICTSCGTTVPPGSLVPNLALRAAVIAFRREDQLAHPNTPKGSKRRRDPPEPQEGTEAKRPNRAQEQPSAPVENVSLDGSRPRGVQFPFVVNDRVLIKGNKRTPERFVGREAAITTQCLNGWYMVRTLDNGESVRLQYRSLQKMGDTNISPDSDVGPLSPSGKLSPGAFLKESPDKSPFSIQRETRAGSSAPLVPSKGPRTEYQKKLNRGSRKSISRPTDAAAPTSSPSGISSNSSREISADQVTGSKTLGEHSKLLAELADEGRDMVRDPKITQAGKLHGSEHAGSGIDHTCHVGSPSRPVADTSSHSKSTDGDVGSVEIKSTRRGRVAATAVGGELPEGGREQEVGVDSITTRSKRSVSHSRGPTFNTTASIADPDPYRKVYTSGSRRRAFMGDASNSLASEQMRVFSPDSKPPVKVSDGDQAVQQIQDLAVVTNGHAGEVKCLQENVRGKASEDIICMMRKDVLKLERMMPWSCLQKSWKLVRAVWRKGVKESQTVLDLSDKVEQFRQSLLLTSAGGMSDEEWGLRLAATKQAGDLELLIPLWGRLYEDVYKWVESKPRPTSSKPFRVDPEFQKHFPQLCPDGLSPVAFTAAATLATADVALKNGQQEAEALVAVMVKQLRQHNRHDLVAIREGLEREKRHIAAKLAHLSESRINGRTITVAKAESLEDATLISNPEAFVTLPTPDCIPIISTAPLESSRLGSTLVGSSAMEDDMLKSPLEGCIQGHGILKSGDESDGGESDAMMLLMDNDGEATDMSDSD